MEVPYGPLKRRSLADRRTGPASNAAATLKARFREMDKDRNGMLDLEELTALLTAEDSALTPESAERLMQCMDLDGSGQVSFHEFVDFIFDGVGAEEGEKEVLLGPDADHAEVLEMLPMKTPKTRAVQMFGAEEDEHANGEYGKHEKDWVVCSTLGHDRFEGTTLNDHPLFQLTTTTATRVLFYGALDRHQAGWFVAEAPPTEGAEVKDYILFNPSPVAETPELCCATWQTPKGNRPKRVFIEGVAPAEWDDEPGEAADCLEEELWAPCEGAADDDLSDDEGGEKSEDEDWNLEWLPENGEFLDESASEEGGSGSEGGEDPDAAAKARAAREAGERKDKAKAKQKHGRPKRKSAVAVHQVAPGFRVVRRESRGAPPPRKQAAAPARVVVAEGNSEEDSPEEDLSQYEDGLFLDYDFPPSKKSLGNVSCQVDGWARLSRLHETPCLFHRIVPDNVIGHTSSGNFWFLSACAVAAECPAWVQSMFGRTTTLVKDAKYHVRMYHPGRKEFLRITVVDYVPAYRKAPVFAGITGDGEIWVALVEKAFAKFCRSYANMEWGLNKYGMLYICGGGVAESWDRMRGPQARASRWKRSRTVWNGLTNCTIDRERAEGILQDGSQRSADQLWAMLRRYMELCYPVSCIVSQSCPPECSLLTDRSYSILGAREVPATDGQALRMVYLRNPFDVGEWSGRWSDESEAWSESPSVRAVLNFSAGTDGTFWMSYYEFLKNFECIDIVKKSMPVQGCNRTKLVGLKRGLGLEST